MRAFWAAVALCGAWLAFGGGVAAEAPEEELLTARGLRPAELERMAAQLGAAAPARREAAFRARSELTTESLPGVAQRLNALRARRPDPEAVREALVAIRHAAGSRRADDTTDLAQGVLSALASRRDAALLAAAEPLLYLRALERMATREAGLLFADLLTLDDSGVWDYELKLARGRVGLRLLPALIELRSHGDARVRNYAQAGVRALGMDDPQVAVQIEDAALAADVVEAYSRPLDFPAMPVIVRLVRADKREVREAARRATARFGKNAIWQLREMYGELTGQDADKGWSAERTAQELYAAIDRPALQEADALLAKGMAHYVAGDLDAMKREYDRLLSLYPRLPQRAKMAPGYAAIGRKLLDADQLEPARDAYQRALRLAPEASDAPSTRAELAYVEAELSLVSGVVDLDGYDAALRNDPDHAAAAEARDRLSGARVERARKHRRLAAGGAIALLLGCVVLLLRSRRAVVATAS
jgi:tetratricopeptide (TPR) repeat protein